MSINTRLAKLEKKHGPAIGKNLIYFYHGGEAEPVYIVGGRGYKRFETVQEFREAYPAEATNATRTGIDLSRL